jgi:hypothetical protein
VKIYHYTVINKYHDIEWVGEFEGNEREWKQFQNEQRSLGKRVYEIEPEEKERFYRAALLRKQRVTYFRAHKQTANAN